MGEAVDGVRNEIDPIALKAKYLAERDKRLREDGVEQYIPVSGRFAHFSADPYAERIERAPLFDEAEVVIVGGGFGGLLTAARLREAGVEDIRIVEKGSDFGGTWYWNRYPGAACDIESYIYIPLLEEVGTMPTEKYAKAPEILAHAQAVARKYDLYRQALLQTEVRELRWDEAIARWIVATDRGDRVKARFVVLGAGFLQQPKLPGIPGIENFKGHAFHTSRWDYGYTGGHSKGELTGLADKAVGIIGTGATGVQCIPHLGAWAKQLFVFQRTPSMVGYRGNRPTDPEWVKTLTPGWQKRRMDNFNILVSGGTQDEDLVGDGWIDVFRNLPGVLVDNMPAEIAEPAQMADYRKMEEIRARIDSIVTDKATAEALKPWYNQFCKRPCFHDEYLPTFNRPNVTLVDTQGRGVERITETGAVVDGKEYPLDCLIFATGFEVGTSYKRQTAMDIIGRGGITLTDKWRDGITTLHGMHVHGFPNAFLISATAHVGGTPNVLHIVGEITAHIAHIIAETRARGAHVVEVTQDAEQAWCDTIVRMAVPAARFNEECTPSYRNNEGKMTEADLRSSFYGGGSVGYSALLEQWRDAGTLEGLALRKG
ncbi:flavin-containing monooxygenase [Flavisphingomonas formosensis]|uniref:flavin-containing monooxygenase n=1 Tax=Flavisphingomonas formosensis TaxID=861534 RepID=UPI0012F8B68E|nr:NAD(P)/FAD-dependent oxidoreductase [Sphingomonas formosensis]